MPRERVYDFKGGPLRIVRVLDLGPVARHEEDAGTFEHVPFAHGFALPQPLLATLQTPDGEPLAEVEIGVVNGRPGCVAIRARGDHELTATFLRRLSPMVRALVNEIVRDRAVRVTRDDDGELVGERYVDAEGSGFGSLRRELVAETDAQLATPRRRRQMSDEFLREVADVYRNAHAHKISTQKAIQERWPTTDANARRWVARARERGFLGKAPAARSAGEQPKGEQ